MLWTESFQPGSREGAGIIFIFTFVISALLFSQINVEIAIYLVLIVIEMLTGYFDDAAEKHGASI